MQILRQIFIKILGQNFLINILFLQLLTIPILAGDTPIADILANASKGPFFGKEVGDIPNYPKEERLGFLANTVGGALAEVARLQKEDLDNNKLTSQSFPLISRVEISQEFYSLFDLKKNYNVCLAPELARDITISSQANGYDLSNTSYCSTAGLLAGAATLPVSFFIFIGSLSGVGNPTLEDISDLRWLSAKVLTGGVSVILASFFAHRAMNEHIFWMKLKGSGRTVPSIAKDTWLEAALYGVIRTDAGGFYFTNVGSLKNEVSRFYEFIQELTEAVSVRAVGNSRVNNIIGTLNEIARTLPISSKPTLGTKRWLEKTFKKLIEAKIRLVRVLQAEKLEELEIDVNWSEFLESPIVTCETVLG